MIVKQLFMHWLWCVLNGVGSEMMTVVDIRIMFRVPFRWMLTISLN